MDCFTEVSAAQVAYDPQKDGVWIQDGLERLAFFPRNIIISMLGVLPANPPKDPNIDGKDGE